MASLPCASSPSSPHWTPVPQTPFLGRGATFNITCARGLPPISDRNGTRFKDVERWVDYNITSCMNRCAANAECGGILYAALSNIKLIQDEALIKVQIRSQLDGDGRRRRSWSQLRTQKYYLGRRGWHPKGHLVCFCNQALSMTPEFVFVPLRIDLSKTNRSRFETHDIIRIYVFPGMGPRHTVTPMS